MQASRVPRRLALSAAVIAAVVALAACGKRHDATQAAARVDDAEITVHQINFRLQRERGLRSDQMDAASRRVLEQLIDEQLLVEAADKAKLDKQPEGEQAIDAARREVLARSYIESAAQTVASPTDAAVHSYYDDNDALFAHRSIYTLHEFLAQVPPERIPELKALVDAGKSQADVAAWLAAQHAPVREQQGVHAAEQIPLGSLKELAATPVGHGLLASSGNQVHVTYVVSSDPQPVTFDRAKPVITQFLLTEARRKATQANVAALTSGAKIEYAAQYASLAASGPAALTTRDIQASAPQPSPDATHVSLPNQAVAPTERVALPATSGSSVEVRLPAASSTGVQVVLPSNAPGVRVSLPTTASSSVEVRLPPQTGTPDTNK